jgi:hypothetical protein
MLRELRASSAPERRALVEAVLGLVVATIAVRVFPFRRTARLVGLTEDATAPRATVPQLARAERIGWAVRTVAGRLPWTSTCVVRALATAALLRLRGIPAQLHLGVDTDVIHKGGFAAHSWISCDGRVLVGDQPHLDRYAVIGTYTVQSVRRK